MFIRKSTKCIEYLNENLQKHRINHPAIFFKDDYYECKTFLQNNQKHNPNGPAVFINNEQYYCLYNVKIDPEDLHAPIEYLKLKYNLNISDQS